MGDIASLRPASRAGIVRQGLLFIVCALACVTIALVEGKDFNWDLINYHVYGPWALLHSRYGADFMAGGPQGYLNPVAQIPLYLMVTGGMDDRLSVALLAVIHAFCPYFTGLIANRLFAGERPAARRLLVAASVLIALFSPLFWGLVGNTFVDPTSTAFLLASLYACLRASDGLRHMWFISGLLFGIGLALKLTLLLFAPAMAAAILAGMQWKRPIGLAWSPLGAVCGAVLAGGSSAVALYRAYGSPTFPLFNAIFRSELASTARFPAHQRFIPDTALEFLARPLRMLDVHSWVYIENSAPDARFLVLSVLALFALIWLIYRCIANRTLSLVPSWHDANSRARWQFFAFFLIGWMCWLLASGNGRYGLVLFMLVGPAIVLLLRALLPVRAIVYFLIVLFGLQGYLMLMSFEHRWTKADWLGTWIEVETSPADRQANGYVLVDVNTNSLVFPYLNKHSAYFAIAGQMSQTDLPTVAQRFEDFDRRWRGHLRLLLKMPEPKRVPDRLPQHRLKLLALHGLRPVNTATKACSRIVVRGDRSARPVATQLLLSCPLEAIPPDSALLDQQREIQIVFDRIASTCQLWFPSSNNALPVPRAAGWETRYEPSDVILFSSSGRIFVSRGDFGPFDVPLGSIRDWAANRAKPPVCHPLPRHYQSDGVSFFK